MHRSAATAHRRHASMWQAVFGGSTTRQPPVALDARVPNAGLPSPQDAQRLSVVRLPQLLSDEEVTEVLKKAASIRTDGAGSIRLQSTTELADPTQTASWDPGGYESNRGDWHTTYLCAHSDASVTFICSPTHWLLICVVATNAFRYAGPICTCSKIGSPRSTPRFAPPR
jgi:hypothetical protein